MKNSDYVNHPIYRKAKRQYYFDRWKWVVWNAFISVLLLARLRENYNSIDAALFLLTTVVPFFLMAVMPKTKFENSKESDQIKREIDDI
ncbi:MAG: hypothetical protein AAGC65_07820 [Mucilaginibacter sp.]|uniref:hypothetical protein n=1 Tax=Mucilaginibacter sp. TaxID=1882438 RepID=UPI0031AF2C15